MIFRLSPVDSNTLHRGIYVLGLNPDITDESVESVISAAIPKSLFKEIACRIHMQCPF